MNSDEIRVAYLRFFEEKGHTVVPGSSLIPQGDPTLLLTSAGMVQFKPYYLGEAVPPNRRLASCQKCFRTTDIEVVGDSSHLTFFEMLGNFSIGDYFKRETISWAWEFVTQRLGLSPERLWATIFLDDDESFQYWREQGIPEERIRRFGEEDNFWGPAGDSGPCGPCSELHYDFGEEFGCGKPSCGPNCDCGRFSEIWNLVFTQYNQDKKGRRTPLPKPNIDTGMGLERTAAIMQGKISVYETDLFVPLLECVSGLVGKKYGSDKAADTAMRVIAEHSRGIVFLIADGVIPSNEGRGYVLRRLLRRAGLFGRRLGLGKQFLNEIARITIQQMGHVYPEIVQREEFILRVIESEEEKFSETLSTGIQLLDVILDGIVKVLLTLTPREQQVLRFRWGLTDGRSRTLEEVGKEFKVTRERVRQVEAKALRKLGYSSQSLKLKRILGEEAFKLYDTYGFPVELTRDIVATRGLPIDLGSFRRMMEKQQERARAAHPFEAISTGVRGLLELPQVPEIQFMGYHNLECKTAVVDIWVGSKSADYKRVGTLQEGQEAILILDSTPFYAEKGGQVGDTGWIQSPSGKFLVTDTISIPPYFYVHQGYVAEGSLIVGDEVEAIVDKERRLDIARNHTATHLLHFALRQVLGEQVEQRGSLVAPDRFRFDFSQLVAMMPEEIQKVNSIVNEKIRQNLKVYSEETPYKKAIKEGATALFGEKYGDVVRVLKIGEPPVSIELCGGTHVALTGEIGFFHIISESSVGSGLRRIEAVTGRGAEAFIDKRLSDLESMAQSLGASPDDIQDKLSDIVSDGDKERKRALALERELSKRIVESLLGQVEVIDGVKVLSAGVPSSRLEALREMCDLLRERMKSGVIVLGTVYDDKPLFIATVTSDLVAKGYDAGKIIGQVAKVTGGGGGGSARLGQAGGKRKDKLNEALRLVKDLI